MFVFQILIFNGFSFSKNIISEIKQYYSLHLIFKKRIQTNNNYIILLETK